MSDIARRTIFYDEEEGVVRWHDWALVVHPLGMFLEPFQEITKKARDADYRNYDASEPMCRIDEMKRHSLDKGLLIYGEQVTGGVLTPRSGR